LSTSGVREKPLDASVRDKDIDVPECGDGLGDARIHLGFVGDVDGNTDGMLGAAKLVGRRISTLLLQVSDSHARIFAREERCSLLALQTYS
jgi:hypothetical protein